MIIGNKIFLKLLSPEDVGGTYVQWMADSEVNRYMECRWNSYTLKDLKKYVKSVNDGKNNFLFGIYYRDNDEHIGNVKIGDINYNHMYGDLGLLIGSREYRGKGLGSEAIALATKYAFEKIKLHKIVATVYSNNIASYKAFLNCGYTISGTLKEHIFFHGGYIDFIILEKIIDK